MNIKLYASTTLILLLPFLTFIIVSCTNSFNAAQARVKLDSAIKNAVIDENGNMIRNAVLYIDAPNQNFSYSNALGPGRADTKEPMSIDHQFIIASVGKTMTAVIVLQLWEEGFFGKNGLDATLAELDIFPEDVIEQFHIKDGVSFGREITIRQLLNHTTGIKDIQHDDENGVRDDYFPEYMWAPNSLGGINVYDEEKGALAFIKCVKEALPEGMNIVDYFVQNGFPDRCNPHDYYPFYQWPHWDYEAWKNDPLDKRAGLINFYLGGINRSPLWKPGTRYHYSDTNFIILAVVIEKLTGNSYHSELRKRIFDPLSMNDTYLRFSSNPQYKNWEHKLSEMWALDMPAVSFGVNLSNDWGGGGQVSTVRDLNYFIRSLAQGKLFKNINTLEEMLKFPTAIGKIGFPFFRKSIGYGCGIFVIPSKDGKIIGHLGSSGTWMLYSYESDISFVGTINEEGEEGERRLLKLLEDVSETIENIAPFMKTVVNVLKNPPA